MAGRKSSGTTRNFRRIISDAERSILLAAGQGCISDGFREILSIYHHLWILGYRPSMSLDVLNVDSDAMTDKKTLKSLSDAFKGHSYGVISNPTDLRMQMSP